MIISPSRDFIIQNWEKFRRLQFPAGSKRHRLTRRESFFSALTEANFLDSPQEILILVQYNRPYFSARSSVGSNWSAIGTAGNLATGSWVHMSVSRKASIRQNKIYLNGQMDLSETKELGRGIGSENKVWFYWQW